MKSNLASAAAKRRIRRADPLAVSNAGPSSPCNALVLQGGGALGAYQAGVYSVLSERADPLHWIVGVSIGAINAALIAGNPPGQRVEKMRAFWHMVSSAPAQQLPGWLAVRTLLNQWSASSAAMFGIPGFFNPRDPSALIGRMPVPSPGIYDTGPLKSTLERLVDFDRINARQIRFAVGAVNVRTGNSVYFDNQHQKIGPEHVMASGALPPGFPAIRIDGEDYWDGGVVSNTPLQYVLDNHVRTQRLLALQVDLFSARGEIPQTLAKVMERQKNIMYSSRTRMNTDALASHLNFAQSLRDLLGRLPASLRQDPSVRELSRQLDSEPIDIVHLIYRDKPYELESKDYEFSRSAVEEHWEAGARDMRNTLEHPDWLDARTDDGDGVTTYDLSEPGQPRIRRPRVASRPAARPRPAARAAQPPNAQRIA